MYTSIPRWMTEFRQGDVLLWDLPQIDLEKGSSPELNPNLSYRLDLVDRYDVTDVKAILREMDYDGDGFDVKGVTVSDPTGTIYGASVRMRLSSEQARILRKRWPSLVEERIDLLQSG